MSRVLWLLPELVDVVLIVCALRGAVAFIGF